MYRVLEVRDTRQFDNNYKPIPGSGDGKKCDHCSKLHEVHVTVQHIKDFSELVVGTTCANKLGVLDANSFSTKSLKTAAIIRRYNAQAEKANSLIDWDVLKTMNNHQGDTYFLGTLSTFASEIGRDVGQVIEMAINHHTLTIKNANN